MKDKIIRSFLIANCLFSGKDVKVHALSEGVLALDLIYLAFRVHFKVIA